MQTDKVSELLQQLATQLGTTAEYLWLVLVKAQGTWALIYTLEAVMWGLLFVAAFIALKRAVKNHATAEESDKYHDWECQHLVWAIAAPLTMLVALIGVVVCAEGAIVCGLQPEYAALRVLLELFKQSS